MIVIILYISPVIISMARARSWGRGRRRGNWSNRGHANVGVNRQFHSRLNARSSSSRSRTNSGRSVRSGRSRRGSTRDQRHIVDTLHDFKGQSPAAQPSPTNQRDTGRTLAEIEDESWSSDSQAFDPVNEAFDDLADFGASASDTHNTSVVPVGGNEVDVIMALCPGLNSSLGCAYYIASEERLYFMEDCKLADISLIDTSKLLF
jgi:hypothetical protein